MELNPSVNTVEEYQEKYGKSWWRKYKSDKLRYSKKPKKGKPDPEKGNYYQEVSLLTEENKHLVEGIEKRGWSNFHIDHKIPVSVGFTKGIPPSVISHPSNLVMLWWEDNLEKGKGIVVDEDNRWIEEKYLTN